METFFSLLERHVQTQNTLVCVGLDPHPGDLPAPTAEAALDFCLRLVRETARYAAAFKPNAAFFELHGPLGWEALKLVIEAVQEESRRLGSVIPVILDAKRGDIASTAEAYAHSAFEKLGAHAITLSPYLGQDSIAPFLADRERGVFVLCKTSNPGADEIQSIAVVETRHVASQPVASQPVASQPAASQPVASQPVASQPVASQPAASQPVASQPAASQPAASQPVAAPPQVAALPLYAYIAARAQAWNTNGNIGLVAGATDPEALTRIRAQAPGLWFLTPGVGAQGGNLEGALRAGLRPDGLGLLINASRSLARAASPREAARDLRDEINEIRRRTTDDRRQSRFAVVHRPSPITRLAQDLVASQCVRFGTFTLKSGKQSPIYLDLRRLISHPAILRRAAQAYAQLLEVLAFDRIAGLPYAALPIGTAVALEMGRPLVYPRREVKDYGTQAAIEGDFTAGETVVVLDDLATTGDTKIEAIRKLEAAGLKVRDVVVLIDRGQGAREALAAAGYTLHAVATLRDLLPLWQASGAVTAQQAAEVGAFLAGA